MSGPVVTFELGRDEALIIYGLMESIAQDTVREAALGELLSRAELLALYRVDGAIERTMPELFSPEYPELLRAARARLEEESKR